MNAATLTFGGKEYPLLFNGAGLFETQVLSADDLPGKVLENSPEGFRVLCGTAAALSAQAEACRRWEGGSAGEPLTAERLLCTARPADVPELRRAVMDAIGRGYSRELGDGGGIDLTLVELSKKNGGR